MIKKVVASTIVLVILGASSTFASANPITPNLIVPRNPQPVSDKGTQTTRQGIEVLTPNRDLTTTNQTLVLSFTAPEGTTVTIEVYHNTSETEGKEDFVLVNEPLKVKVGSWQRSWAEVELKQGINRIIFKATYKNGSEDTVIRTVTVKHIEEVKKEVQKLMSTSLSEALKIIANPGAKP